MTTPVSAATQTLAGTRAFVTGGTKGIGAAIATHLLAAGAQVVVCARSEPATLPTHGEATCDFVAADLRDAEAAASAVDAAARILGGLDLVVNNAGGSPPVPAEDMSPRLADKIVALNLLAPFYVSQQAHHHMQADGGQIINIGSIAADEPSLDTAVYGAAKGGLRALSRALGLEWGPAIRVNHITVGLVLTEGAVAHYGGAETVAAMEALIAARRMATPADVAAACVVLAGSGLDYLNGADLRLDGGGQVPAWTTPLRAGPATARPTRGDDERRS